MKRLASVVALMIFAAPPALAFDHAHAAWTQWLKSHVSTKGPSSTVDYKAAKADRASLEGYVKTVTSLSRAEFDGFAPKEKLAFLINAYNALTIKFVVENYPIKSIKDLGGLFASPWKKKFFTLLGTEENLDGIEHERIRKEFSDPRIHVALVCASKGCPALKNEAFVATRLDDQLEAAMKSFLSDGTRNRYDAKKNRLTLSKIFDWYSGDFEKKAGSVAGFVAPYFAASAADQATINTASVSHLPYDWSLNATP